MAPQRAPARSGATPPQIQRVTPVAVPRRLPRKLPPRRAEAVRRRQVRRRRRRHRPVGRRHGRPGVPSGCSRRRLCPAAPTGSRPPARVTTAARTSSPGQSRRAPLASTARSPHPRRWGAHAQHQKQLTSNSARVAAIAAYTLVRSRAHPLAVADRANRNAERLPLRRLPSGEYVDNK